MIVNRKLDITRSFPTHTDIHYVKVYESKGKIIQDDQYTFFKKKNITRPDDVKRKIIPIDKQIAYLMILMYFFFHSFSP